MSDMSEMEEDIKDWKQLSLRFFPTLVKNKLEGLLLAPRNGDKLLAEELKVPQEKIKNAGLSGLKTSPADILDYLRDDGRKTWGDFYTAVVVKMRYDIQTDVLDNWKMQKAILDCYRNSLEYQRKYRPRNPQQGNDPAGFNPEIDNDNSEARGQNPFGGKPGINLDAKDRPINVYINTPVNLTVNGQFPSPTSPGCEHCSGHQTLHSDTLLSGGSINFQNSEKRPMPYHDEQNKKQACGVEETPMETNELCSVASERLPNISTILPMHSTGMNTGNKGTPEMRGLTQNTGMADQAYHSMPMHGGVQGSGRQAQPTSHEIKKCHPDFQGSPRMKENMKLQSTAPNSPHSLYHGQQKNGHLPRSLSESHHRDSHRLPASSNGNVPPSRSQSVTDQMATWVGQHAPNNVMQAPRPGAKHISWPRRGGPVGTAGPAKQSNSEPWNIQYSEFRRGRLLCLFNKYNRKQACTMMKYFYNECKIGVKQGYWSVKEENPTSDDIGREIIQDVHSSDWIAICINKAYLEVINDIENDGAAYRPVPRNKDLNLRFTYALLRAEHQSMGPNARKIILFYSSDVNLAFIPSWLAKASSQMRYELSNDPAKFLKEEDIRDLCWIFRHNTLLNDHMGQQSIQARLYKKKL